jgi:choline dehydrogenase-like flavoprotein
MLPSVFPAIARQLEQHHQLLKSVCTCILQTEGSERVAIHFKARAVVASAGALHTPALLLRSGITGGGNVGKHLRLHPATFALGYFDQRAA